MNCDCSGNAEHVHLVGETTFFINHDGRSQRDFHSNVLVVVFTVMLPLLFFIDNFKVKSQSTKIITYTVGRLELSVECQERDREIATVVCLVHRGSSSKSSPEHEDNHLDSWETGA
ncbi:hypothetical protein J6590_064994 [Homalodisca vitripennis]|nr:hypothetical protein J6590_064994 [Homalodisca vitripennis]